MKKLIYLFVIVLFSQIFINCTNNVEEEFTQIENVQNDDGDDGGDDINEDEE